MSILLFIRKVPFLVGECHAVFGWGGATTNNLSSQMQPEQGSPMKRDSRFDSCTAASFRDNGKIPPDEMESFAHTNQSESMFFALGSRSEANSVVRDLEINFVAISDDIDDNVFSVAMFGDVMQCFLQDSKQAERDVSG